MGDAPKRLFPWRNLVSVVVLLLGWAAYRLATDYRREGECTQGSVVATAVALGVGLAITGAVFWQAGRPERGAEP